MQSDEPTAPKLRLSASQSAYYQIYTGAFESERRQMQSDEPTAPKAAYYQPYIGAFESK